MQRADILTQTPEAILQSNVIVASPFLLSKTRKDAAKNWNAFYKQNSNRFFKDRHWTDRELFADLLAREGPLVVLEIGCGTGSLIYPLLEQHTRLCFHACDFAANAINEVRKHPQFSKDRVNAFEFDITSTEAPLLSDKLAEHEFKEVEGGLVDLASCIFVLSAIPPEMHDTALRNLVASLKPNGTVVMRDYALHDAAQLRFHTRPSNNYSDPSLLGGRLYRRSDQTMSYFFTVEEVTELFERHGLRTEDCHYVERETENRKERIVLKRRFVQGTWRKA